MVTAAAVQVIELQSALVRESAPCADVRPEAIEQHFAQIAVPLLAVLGLAKHVAPAAPIDLARGPCIGSALSPIRVVSFALDLVSVVVPLLAASSERLPIRLPSTGYADSRL